ncbi:MAG: hypothetical protein K2K13_02135 [Clostridiales bacterium]|nr:hypothetical protein [Clostridiales bacterium]
MKSTKSTLCKLCAALLATVSCGTLFAACGNGDETPAQHKHNYATTWTTDNNDHWHECKNSGCDQKEKDKAPHDWNDGQITTEATANAVGVKTYTCKVCNKTKTEAVEYVAPLTESTDFAALVSDKVTEAEWKAAFAEASFSNVTIKHRDNGYDRQQILKIDKTAERDNRKLSSFRKEDEQWVERIPVEPSFWSVENNAMTCYEYDYENQDFNTVYKYIISLENLDENMQDTVDWMTTYKMACPDFGEFYNSFTYDDTLHAYVCTSTLITNGMFEDWEKNYTDITIKIVSGRLAYVSVYGFNVEYDSTTESFVPTDKDSASTELFIYDYGTTQVTMPTNAIDYPEEEEGPNEE